MIRKELSFNDGGLIQAQHEQPDEQGLAVLQEQKIKPPSMYQVALLNDDFTPMDFVVMILQRVFHKNGDDAVDIMLKVHHEGRGVCGVYSKDIAATKIEQVLSHARDEGHPLQCVMEEV